MNKNRIPILSLFCGCGGFDLGFKESGFDVLLALDKSASAVRSYNYNHAGNVARVVDLTCTSGPMIEQMLNQSWPGVQVRGIIGGAPCQSFSQGNVYQRSDDVRNTLPRRFAEILKHFNRAVGLDFFVFENVQGINSAKHIKTFKRFKTHFEAAGFRLFEGLLDAQQFNVPQMRPRVFVVGLNSSKYASVDFLFPRGNSTMARTVSSAIGGLTEPAFFHKGLCAKDIPLHPNHWTMVPKSKKFHDGTLKEGEVKGRSFRVLAWDKPSWTVAYGNREIHIHPSGRRRLSVYEAMLLQGFPSSYRLLGTLSDQVRQVSDSVPSQVGFALASAISDVIASR